MEVCPRDERSNLKERRSYAIRAAERAMLVGVDNYLQLVTAPTDQKIRAVPLYFPSPKYIRSMMHILGAA